MQSGKAQVKEVGGHEAQDKKQIPTSNWWISHPGSVHTMFYSRDSLYSPSFISEKLYIRGMEGGLINLLPVKRGDILETGALIEGSWYIFSFVRWDFSR